MTFSELREEVHWANCALPASGLVTMHSGNASGIHRESGIILIKPSGVDYTTLRPEDLLALHPDGTRAQLREIPDGIESGLRPSVDAPHHVALYAADITLGGIIHTHSNHATAWAAHEKPIPCVLTAMADEFGGDIPCTPYVDNQGDNIVRAILAHRSPRAAFKAAIMGEDLAKTLLLSLIIGPIQALPASEISRWWDRYHSSYGQTSG